MVRPKAIRILFLFGNLQLGGAERQGLLFAQYLKERQQREVMVWGLGPERGPVADRCEQLGIPWRALPVHWGLRRRIPHLLRLFWQLRVARPTVLISYTKVPNLAAALLWRLSGIRLCIWNQADAGLLLPATLLHRLAVGQVNHFVANAESGRQYLLDTFGLESSRIRLIRNGVGLAPPAADRRTWRQRLGIDDETLLAVMVANLSSYKDHATLLHAWRQVVSQAAPGRVPVLALAGRFDDQAEPLQQQSRQLGIDGQLRFLGAVDDIGGLLQTADLLVHSSVSEGIPNAVLEAMASGLPVVGTDIPGLSEAVGDEGRELLAPVKDAEVLAGLLNRLLRDPVLRRTQGELMRQRAEQLFSRERMCRESTAYLEESLESLV